VRPRGRRTLKHMRGTEPTFRLRRYSTLAGNLDICSEILRRIDVSLLQSIHIQSMSSFCASDVENFFGTVESRCSPSVLREITITERHDDKSDFLTDSHESDPVPSALETSLASVETFRPLFSFSYLEQLHVEQRGDIAPAFSSSSDDDSFEIFRESWPKMRSLVLVDRDLKILRTV